MLFAIRSALELPLMVTLDSIVTSRAISVQIAAGRFRLFTSLFSHGASLTYMCCHLYIAWAILGDMATSTFIAFFILSYSIIVLTPFYWRQHESYPAPHTHDQVSQSITTVIIYFQRDLFSPFNTLRVILV